MLPNQSLPECIGYVFDCDSAVATCHNSVGFDFTTLWTITQQYYKQCPTGTWLFADVNTPISNSSIALTNGICKQIAGDGFTRYPGPDVWNRLTTWKFPLFQLVFNAPRPPLGFWVEAFTFAHFLGDPIGTIADLLRKVDSCQSRAMFWQDQLERELLLLRDQRTRAERRRLWKSLAIIVDSFDEWGTDVGDQAQRHLAKELAWLCCSNAKEGDARKDLRQSYLKTLMTTADALAADRSTKFLPVVIAQAFFVGAVAIAMIRTESASDGPTPTMFADVEMFSIAFTAQFFWVTFVVVWKSVIGTSQTAAAIPQILSRLQDDLTQKISGYGMIVSLPTAQLRDKDRRIYGGGIYSWQPVRRKMPVVGNSTLDHCLRRIPPHRITQTQRLLKAISSLWPYVQHVLPFAVVAIAASTGQLISAFVPPVDWNCRNTGMMWMFATWTISYSFSFIPMNANWAFWFWATLIKDFLAVGVTMGIVMATQFGYYNRCDCFTKYGGVGVQLPFMPDVRSLLDNRMHNTYPTIVAVGLAFQLILIPGTLVWRYHAAVQVFLQRDDGTSNMGAWHRFQEWRRARYHTAVAQTDETNSSELIGSRVERGESIVTIKEVESDVSGSV